MVGVIPFPVMNFSKRPCCRSAPELKVKVDTYKTILTAHWHAQNQMFARSLQQIGKACTGINAHAHTDTAIQNCIEIFTVRPSGMCVYILKHAQGWVHTEVHGNIHKNAYKHIHTSLSTHNCTDHTHNTSILASHVQANAQRYKPFYTQRHLYFSWIALKAF